MKRFLHALAALWPKKRATGSPPLADPSTAIPQHLAAVLRMERALSGFADSPIHEFAEEAVGAGALSTVRDQSTESPDTRLTESSAHQLPESSAQQLNESPDTRLIESPDTRLTDSTAQQLNESPDTRLIESPDTRLNESPNQPQSLPRKPQPMPLLTILMLTFFMCLMAAKQVSAQAEPAEAAVIKPLQIGDTIPEELWHLPLQVVNHPEGKETITLNDYRGKLIILDFWATWCGPCIASMYKLDTLQGQFAEELVILPTTYEHLEKVVPFFYEKGWNLPTTVSESTLKRYFPHQSIPHQVWLKDGKLLAVAGHEYATEEYVSKVLNQDTIAFKHKIEVPFDKDKPLFLNGNGGDGSNVLYQSVISGRMNAKIGGVTRPSSNQINAYNRTIEELYLIALGHRISSLYNENYIHKYIKFEIHDSLKYRINPSEALATKNSSIKERWMAENWYCYGLIGPENEDASALNDGMFNELNDFFRVYLGFDVAYEKRYREVLALVYEKKTRDIRTKGWEKIQKVERGKPHQITIQNQPVSSLVHFLNYHLAATSDMPVVDDTGIDGNIDLIIDLSHDNIETLRGKLAEHGLDLVQKTYPLNMIVFKYCSTP